MANTEIDTRKMEAEGSCDREPGILEIIGFLRKREYKPFMISIIYDKMQSVWRWDCKIKIL